jgi:NAD(P)-dependent dehydrogenase (short-subunit alcohol dehydrogenase family)
MSNNESKITLVTGASSGIGRATARLLAKEGYTVYGTSRRANYETVEFEGASYTMLPLTLEDEESVKRAVEYIIEKHGKLDLLVNVAGSGIAGAIEETTAEEAMEQFDVCFFGVIRVLGCALPHMRGAGGGMIINIGSLSACFPVPFQAMYSACKAALFSLTTALRMELKPFGIKACTVEPGNTISGFMQSRTYAKKTCATQYRTHLERSLCVINSEYAAYSPETCAKTVLKVSRMKNPPARVTPGFGYKLLYGLSKLVSWRLKQKAIETVYLKKNPSPDGWTFDKQFKEK